ncbi:hypothetical protein OPV22_000947 [Ensete ventricosum]|uniref:Uncharacterized protein n=1 Tax=Ensete ventricosum TaxID=4639 RepID=A0AAV8RSN7_ENSVE|nr:hypothetical protein OPV22_000947 [Ensete ventricosum]
MARSHIAIKTRNEDEMAAASHHPSDRRITSLLPGKAPVKPEPDVPSKGISESHRAMPVEALLPELRENHPLVSRTRSPKHALRLPSVTVTKLPVLLTLICSRFYLVFCTMMIRS